MHIEYAVIGFMPLQALEAVVGIAVIGLAAYRRPTEIRPPQYVTGRTTAMDLGPET
jgi:hypothetical protein